jgi:hypothetical protein
MDPIESILIPEDFFFRAALGLNFSGNQRFKPVAINFNTLYSV